MGYKLLLDQSDFPWMRFELGNLMAAGGNLFMHNLDSIAEPFMTTSCRPINITEILLKRTRTSLRSTSRYYASD